MGCVDYAEGVSDADFADVPGLLLDPSVIGWAGPVEDGCKLLVWRIGLIRCVGENTPEKLSELPTGCCRTQNYGVVRFIFFGIHDGHSDPVDTCSYHSALQSNGFICF